MLETVHCSTQKYFNENEEINICGFKAVSDTGDKIGSIHDYVIDETDQIRYLVVDTGFWIFGKKVLVPVGRIDVRDRDKEVILRGLTKDQVGAMPEYKEGEELTEEYETDVMDSYYPTQDYARDRETGRLRYDQEDAFRVPERLQLVQERLQVSKHREQVGEVNVKKRVETHRETIDVPLEKERLVVDTNAPEGAFREQSINVPLYEEKVDVSKRAVVGEEVTLRKEKDIEQRTVSEDVREEVLDVDKDVDMRKGESRGRNREPIDDDDTLI
jgi:uncharacterized protein (TIGR02271 family)